MPLIAMLAKKHAENKAKYGDKLPSEEEKKPALEVAIGVGKKKDDTLPPTSKDIAEGEEYGDVESPEEDLAEGFPPEADEAEPFGDDAGEEVGESELDTPKNVEFIKSIVSQMLDERLGNK